MTLELSEDQLQPNKTVVSTFVKRQRNLVESFKLQGVDIVKTLALLAGSLLTGSVRTQCDYQL